MTERCPGAPAGNRPGGPWCAESRRLFATRGYARGRPGRDRAGRRSHQGRALPPLRRQDRAVPGGARRSATGGGPPGRHDRRATADPWERFTAGCQAFLTPPAPIPRFEQIMLIDGPAVLGWTEWRAMDEARVRPPPGRSVDPLIEEGPIAPQPVAPTHPPALGRHQRSGALASPRAADPTLWPTPAPPWPGCSTRCAPPEFDRPPRRWRRSGVRPGHRLASRGGYCAGGRERPHRRVRPARRLADRRRPRPQVVRPHAGDALPADLDGYAAAGRARRRAGRLPGPDRRAGRALVPAARGAAAQGGPAPGADARRSASARQLLATRTAAPSSAAPPARRSGPALVGRRDAADTDPLFAACRCARRAAVAPDEITELPLNATLLAASTRYPLQAFRIGDRAWGLQFHIECDPRCSPTWAADARPLAELGIDPVDVLAAVDGGAGRRRGGLAAVRRPVRRRGAGPLPDAGDAGRATCRCSGR